MAASPAASAPVAGAGGEAAPQTATDAAIESARESVRETAIWLASGVDSWFGDRPFSQGGKVSDGRLSVDLQTRPHDGPSFDVRFNARFQLPNLDRLTYVFVGRDDQQALISDKPGVLSRQNQLQTVAPEDRAFFAGVGRPLNDVIDFRLGVRGGLKPYAQARARRVWNPDAGDRVDLRETLFWTLADRIGATTALSVEHAFSPTVAARWVNAATVTQAQPNFVWSSIAGAYRSFGGERRLSIEALVDGQQDSGVGATDYGVQTRWEQPVRRAWLLGSIVFGRFWPRTDPSETRRGAWVIGVRLEMRL